MRNDLAEDVDRDVVHARHSLRCRHQLLAQLGHQALGRVAKLHVEGDIACGDLHIAQRTRAHIILAGIGVTNLGKRLHETLFGNGHNFIYSSRVG
ncbi:hypothetical protein SDC9_152413 [bioreactor metagenome]|uniref:Uncharacterized protein n=1 Tax=bioreactor metagenome TaxID=1076179 RepID=A0A645EXD8_9ZZZZ